MAQRTAVNQGDGGESNTQHSDGEATASSSKATIELELCQTVDLASVKPERLSLPELRVLVSELSSRSVDVSRLSRAELLDQRDALVQNSQQAQRSPNPPAAAAASSSPASSSSSSSSSSPLPLSTAKQQSIQHDVLASEAMEVIDPGLFPDVNWRNLTGSTHAVGGFSCVVFSTYKGRAVALKVFKQPQAKESLAGHWKEVRKEICILQEVARGHPNLCPIVGLTRNPLNDAPVIIMWRLDCELRSYLRSHVDLPVERRLAMVYEVALALLWMHDRASPVLHLDLKLENLMLDDRGRVVLCDFGLSLVLPQGMQSVRIAASQTRAKKGNVSHRAPELCVSKEDIHFGPPVDVYALGICAWEIVTGLEWGTAEVKKALLAQGAFERAAASRRPVADLQHLFVDSVLHHGFRPPLRPDWPAAFTDLLTAVWHGVPERRPSIRTVVEQLSPAGPVVAAFRARDAELRKQLVVDYVRERLAPDPVAVQVARAAFRSSPAAPWRSFVHAFWQHYLPAAVPHQHGAAVHPSYDALLELALVDSAHPPNRPVVVQFESFAKCVDAFRPLDAMFFERIREVVDKPYVHLHWDGDTTRLQLHGAAEGTFAVRYSDKSGAAFTVTKILGDRAKANGAQVCVRHRIYRDEEDAGFVYRLGHRDFARERFASFSDIFEDPAVAHQLRTIHPVNREWVSPLARLALPACADSGVSAPPAHASRWEDVPVPSPEPNPYYYLPETVLDQPDADPQRTIVAKLGQKLPMSPERAMIDR